MFKQSAGEGYMKIYEEVQKYSKNVNNNDNEKSHKKKHKHKKNENDEDAEPRSSTKTKHKKDKESEPRSSKKHKKKAKDDEAKDDEANVHESKSKKKSLKSANNMKRLDSDNEEDNENLDEVIDETKRGKELIKNAIARGEIKLLDYENLKGVELQLELERENNERQQRMLKYIKFEAGVIDTSNAEQLDDQVMTLENELAILKDNINQFLQKSEDAENNKSESKAMLLRKKDWLAFKSLELEHLFDTTGYKFEMLDKKHKAMQEALKNIESVKTDMKKIVKYRAILSKLQSGLAEAEAVITEMQNMAYNLLPKNVSRHCKNVEATRKRLIDMQDDLLEKKHFAKKELVITGKEIIAINQALTGELEATKILETRKQQELQRLVHFQAKNNEIDEIISSCNEKLDMMNLTLEEAQEMANVTKNEAEQLIEKSSDEVEVHVNVKEEKIKETKQMNKLLKEQIGQIDTQIEVIEKDIANNQKYINQSAEIRQILEHINKATVDRRLQAERLQTERVLRKTYYNQIEDMKGAIRVYCRVRPVSQTEKERHDTICVEFPDIYTVLIKQPKKKIPADRTKEFLFDRVFPLNSTQKEVFVDIDRLIETVFSGFNVCIFAYGQTGSGKTFTLIGDMNSKENMGVVPRAFIRFYEIIDLHKQTTSTETTFYMLELYNDKLLDLMKSDAEYVENLKILKNEHGMVIVPGITMLNAKNTNDMVKYFHQANNNRHIAATKMNSESSRSHLVLTIMFTFTNKSNNKKFFGKISMIDLAGSERLVKSGATGIHQTEAASINKALTALGDVISALTTMNKGFVPYRNNKLTQLMQDSLGGTAKTLLIVNLSPVDYNISESISSLNYAARMKTIINENLKVADDDEVTKLKEIIQKLLRGDPVTIE